MELSKEILKGHIDTLILAVLREEDGYGYQIAKDVKIKSEHSFDLKEGTMYLSFKRLETKGYIESYWGDENIGGRRKYYKITDEGLQALKEKTMEWMLLKNVMDSFL